MDEHVCIRVLGVDLLLIFIEHNILSRVLIASHRLLQLFFKNIRKLALTLNLT